MLLHFSAQSVQSIMGMSRLIVASNPVDFTLRLSPCRFHGASTNEISSQNTGSKKPSKTKRFQGLDGWLRG